MSSYKVLYKEVDGFVRVGREGHRRAISALYGGAPTYYFDIVEREGGSLRREEEGVSRRLNEEVGGGASLDGTRFIVLVLCRIKELSIYRLRACLHN
jgi:hypothetical protein